MFFPRVGEWVTQRGLGVLPANARRRYIVTTSLIGCMGTYHETALNRLTYLPQ